MQPADSTARLNPSQLRSFITPPPELQKRVQAVAEHVARHGPAAEFQLRSRDKDEQYPFLVLDNQYAPFYQYRLAEARTRARSIVSDSAKSDPKFSHAASEKNVLETPSMADPEHSFLTYEDGLEEIAKYTYDQTLNYNSSPAQSDEVQEVNSNGQQACQVVYPQSEFNDQGNANLLVPHHSQLISHETPDLENEQGRSEVITIDTSTTEPSSDVPEPLQMTIPYGILQEVHLLDSSGSDDNGLCTYVIINNDNDTDELLENALEAYFDQSSETFQIHRQRMVDRIGQEPFYRLRPDISTIFRAPHHRLLPVGFALGTEVKMTQQNAIGIVTRRPVEMGQRMYDVTDQLGTTHHNVAESDLELHRGGIFNFRLPHQL